MFIEAPCFVPFRILPCVLWHILAYALVVDLTFIIGPVQRALISATRMNPAQTKLSMVASPCVVSVAPVKNLYREYVQDWLVQLAKLRWHRHTQANEHGYITCRSNEAGTRLLGPRV